MNRVRTLLIFGTRPEAVKMAPVVQACRCRSRELEPIVCLTGQHRDMLQPVTDYFGIAADVHLGVMAAGQSLAQLTSRCVEGIDRVLAQFQPDCVVAQGDTTTAMAASMAAFYRRVPFVHVEAGLRTGNLEAPWPEEFNRRIAALTTAVHCAPTQLSAENLLREGIPAELIHVTGNPVVDALLWTVARERARGCWWNDKYAFLGTRRVVLMTGHRRENFGPAFRNICRAVLLLSERHAEVEFVFPVHLNPQVREPAGELLSGRPNIHLLPPLPYPEFVWLMDRAALILTDSGGVQEEAPSLGKPVLVTRNTTERPEALAAGAVELVGTATASIVAAIERLLSDPAFPATRPVQRNPYGDGRAAGRIAQLIASRQWQARSGGARPRQSFHPAVAGVGDSSTGVAAAGACTPAVFESSFACEFPGGPAVLREQPLGAVV